MQSSEDRPARHADGALVLDAVRHRWASLLAVALGVAIAVLVLVYQTPSRYDAETIVGFAPNAEAPVSVDEVKLGASQSAMSATSRAVLTQTEAASDVPKGTLMAENVQAEVIPETGMIQLVVSDGDPRVAAALATELADTLVAEADTDLLNAEVVKAAEVPTAPAAPARGLYTLAGLIGGLGIGLCLVLAWEAWRPRVRGPAHLGRILGVSAVTDLRRAASDSAPVTEMRPTQLRLTRGQPVSESGEGRGPGLPEVTVAGARGVSRDAVAWVADGLAGALDRAGHDVQLAESGVTEADFSAGGPIEVRLVPARLATRRNGSAIDQVVRRAVVVVNERESVSSVEQLRHDLDAADIPIIASVLGHDRRRLPWVGRRMGLTLGLGSPGQPSAQRSA